MIRVEGIPIVTARLTANAQQGKPIKGRKPTTRGSETNRKLRDIAFRTAVQVRTKVAENRRALRTETAPYPLECPLFQGHHP